MELLVRNVSEALWVGTQMLREHGVLRTSRGGDMLEMGPVMTTYSHPRERVLFYPERDANPFFHLFEALWMLGGRDDVDFLACFNKRMTEYSTDGKTFNGAYGFRWRFWFGYDQLDVAVERLKNYENDRRTVIAHWDPWCDLTEKNTEKDVPCNTHIYLKVRDGALNMTVCCRSNDIIWGAYGANAVHFSILQEYLAARVGVVVGSYTQLSDSYHAYLPVLDKLQLKNPDYDPYLTLGKDGLHYTPEPLIAEGESVEAFERDIERFLTGNVGYGYETRFFVETVEMMLLAHRFFKQGLHERAIIMAYQIKAADWRKACVEWLERRKK